MINRNLAEAHKPTLRRTTYRFRTADSLVSCPLVYNQGQCGRKPHANCRIATVSQSWARFLFSFLRSIPQGVPPLLYRDAAQTLTVPIGKPRAA
jgi:hypothetical protein